MKPLYILLLLLLHTGLYAQKNADELARKAFAACIKNNDKAFKILYPSDAALNLYFKTNDPKKQFPKDIAKRTYPDGEKGALYGFNLFQKAIKVFDINTADIQIGKSEMVENDIEIMKAGKKVGSVYNKIISLYFTSGGKQYAFVVPNAIQVRGRWYLSDRIVSLHEIEAEN